jgi:geranylgeranyl pyrophosphate synthase
MMAALLVQDDLADRDRVRYGRATIWARFGTPAAVHLGAALLALAFRRLDHQPSQTRSELQRRMTSCAMTACWGQAAEAVLERNLSVGLAEVLDVYAAKTGVPASYFFSSGAVSVNAPADRVQAASRLGASFGLAFQLRNDFASLWEDTQSKLEDPLSDLRQRKPTAIAAFALERCENAADDLADFYHSRQHR